jgi:hypothetical protein
MQILKLILVIKSLQGLQGLVRSIEDLGRQSLEPSDVWVIKPLQSLPSAH